MGVGGGGEAKDAVAGTCEHGSVGIGERTGYRGCRRKGTRGKCIRKDEGVGVARDGLDGVGLDKNSSNGNGHGGDGDGLYWDGFDGDEGIRTRPTRPTVPR